MTVQVAILVSMMFVSLGLSAETKEVQKPSMKETITWMDNFSGQHGFLTNAGVTRMNALRAIKDCAVSIEITYPNAKKTSQPKKLNATILLSDFDPNAVREETDKDAGTYEVEFERSDSSPEIEESVEMADGSKTKWFVAEESLFFDSEESARRFARALVHAINLCGGTPAPF
jgi:hypothetical protein